MTRRALAALVVSLAALAACEDRAALVLDDWQLEVPGRDARAIRLPAHPDIPRSVPGFRLRREVELPPELRDRPLTLTLGAVQALIEVRAAGREAVPLDGSDFDVYRTRGWNAWRIEPSPGPRLLIELDIANSWASSTWLDDAPRLSATERGNRRYLLTNAWSEWSGGATIAILGLLTAVYLVTFLIDRRRKAEGWFACITASILLVTGFMQAMTQRLFGTWDGAVAMAAVTLASLFSVYFAHANFALRRPHRAWLLILPFLAVVEVLWSDHWDGLRIGVPILAGVWFLVIAYQVGLLVWLRSTRRPAPRHSGALLICWGVTGLAGLFWLLPWVGVSHLVAVTLSLPGGFGFYAVVQSIVLSRDRALAALEAERLTGELEERVAELERGRRELDLLHRDLSGRIAARSSRISQALATLAPLSAAMDRAGDRAWAFGILRSLAGSLADLHAGGAAHGRLRLDAIFLDQAGRPVLPPPRAGADPAGDLSALAELGRQLLADQPLPDILERCLAGRGDPPTAAEVVAELVQGQPRKPQA